MPKVLVLGATSAVAQELALQYAARGAELYLVGRSAQKLDALAARLPSEGRATFTQADLNQTEEAETLIQGIVASFGPIDVAIIAHGLLGDQLRSERDFAEALLVTQTNYLSVVSLVIPLANHFERVGRGHLVVLSSVAGERGRPRNYTYGAAKGAVTLYLQGVRSRLWPKVGVHTIKLGPVDSPMTVDHPKNVLFATCPRVAKDIIRVVDNNVAEAYVPYYWWPIMKLVKNLPEWVFQRFASLSGR
jgi:decaprenylphospho-beta-D-erythro-pentofuranosid-2-ulose 2-reductase